MLRFFSNKDEVLSKNFYILFLIFISLSIYYPSIFASINTVDDEDMITNLLNIDSINFKSIFFPGTNIQYYRPVLYLTFIFDRFVWLCDESFMHLENVIVHTINGILVFFVSREILKKILFKPETVSFFIALFFLLHPLNTEPVNWISGRTDLLAGMFVLLSIYFLLTNISKGYIWIWFSAIIYFLGLLSKESALSLLVVIMVLILINEEKIGFKFKGRKIKILIPYVIFTGLYFLIRNLVAHVDKGLSSVTNPTNGNFLINIGSIIKAIGFYVKKLFLPVPLNFCIVDINRTFYFWFGLLIILICLFLIKRRRLLDILFLNSVIFFLPATVLPLAKMTWTPLAERYLYLSTFTFSFFIVLLIKKISIKNNLSNIVIIVLLVISCIITAQRNIVWQNNYTLFKDTVKKSPNFAPARNEYGIALAKMGRKEEAIEQFKYAQFLSKGNHILSKLNIIEEKYFNDKDYNKIISEYNRILKEKNSPEVNIKVLKRIIQILEYVSANEKNKDKSIRLYIELLNYYKALTDYEKSDKYLYRLGQLYLSLGYKENAKNVFYELIKLHPKSQYSLYSSKLLKKI